MGVFSRILRSIRLVLLSSSIVLASCSHSFAKSTASTVAEDCVTFELSYLPEKVIAGVKPITLTSDMVKRIVPELREARLMTYEDLRYPEDQRAFVEEGYTFVLAGDFNKDGYADLAFVGKYDHNEQNDPGVFLAILSFRGKTVVRDYLSTFARDRAFLSFISGFMDNRGGISIGFAMQSDDCGFFYWTGKRYAFESCLSFNKRLKN
jgi:hypothetical protein